MPSPGTKQQRRLTLMMAVAVAAGVPRHLLVAIPASFLLRCLRIPAILGADQPGVEEVEETW